MKYRLGVQMGARASAGAVPNNDSSTAPPNPARKGALTAWHPTTAYLVCLVLAEFAAYLLLRNAFKHAHGG